MARNQGSVLEDVASDRDRHPNAVPLPPTPPDHDETTLVCRAAHARRIPKREDLIRFERRARKRTTSFILIEPVIGRHQVSISSGSSSIIRSMDRGVMIDRREVVVSYF